MSTARVLSNAEVAEALVEVGDLLAATGANPARVGAWHEGARAVRELGRPLGELLAEGGSLPGVGGGLARAIEALARRGSLSLLDRLHGHAAPEVLFSTIPGIGGTLSSRLHTLLGVSTLEELEVAAYDGRVEHLAGFGARRTRALRDSLASLLGRASQRHARAAEPPPPVATILEVDDRYHREAAAGALPRIAPRRFNPEHRVWLPVLHEERDGFQLSAIYSNTALAHRLGRTDDWVIVYWGRQGAEDGQYTVVTQPQGPMAGRRVVRGREAECARLYRV